MEGIHVVVLLRDAFSDNTFYRIHPISPRLSG